VSCLFFDGTISVILKSLSTQLGNVTFYVRYTGPDFSKKDHPVIGGLSCLLIFVTVFTKLIVIFASAGNKFLKKYHYQKNRRSGSTSELQ